MINNRNTKNVFGQTLHRIDHQYQQMGTQFKFILYSSDKNKAQHTVNQSIKRIDELNQIFSDYEENSEISLLSASAGSGKKVKISSELWTVLRYANRYSKKSKGAFDITIGPLSKLWRSMFRKSEIFNGVKINDAKGKVGYQKIRYYPFSKRVKLKQKGMRLDAGGIAKGYTVDEVAKIFKKNGHSQFLIDGGGDIIVGSPPPNKKGWSINISIENNKGEKESKIIIVKNTAIASSGDTYRFLEWEGKRYSHIIDPRTGYGVIDQNIINVQARTCIQADVLASCLSVLNEEKKVAFLEKIKEIKVF